MRFLLYSGTTDEWIPESAGRPEYNPEYNYHLLMNDLRPLLAGLGTVTIVQDPRTQVDAIFKTCRARAEACAFICFTPPEFVPRDLLCPTWVVLAWSYGAIAGSQKVDGNKIDADGLRALLGGCEGAIVFSNYVARLVESAMGPAFPVSIIVPPLWDRFGEAQALPVSTAQIGVRGIVVDTHTTHFSADSLVSSVRPLEQSVQSLSKDLDERAAEAVTAAAVQGPAKTPAPTAGAASFPAPPEIVEIPEIQLDLRGVVYTAVFDPTDHSKNWMDMLTAFCWAFRETEDVTLVMKMASENYGAYRDFLIHYLSRLMPFKCRVIAIQAHLNDLVCEQLTAVTNYYVNTSETEVISTPLIGFMARGKPAIAPHHTGMEAYVDDTTSFVVQASRYLNTQPFDPRLVHQVERFRLNWESLLALYRESYAVAKTDPARYSAMSAAAAERSRSLASAAICKAKFRALFVPAVSFSAAVAPNPAQSVAT